MNSFAIFVLPFLYEGHPKALLEAMSCGLPVIGTNVPGIRELIRHGENGWLVDTDAESIRAGIKHLLSNEDLRNFLGNNARQFILDNFSLEKIVDKEYMLYQKFWDINGTSDIKS